jgi:hypothetical protein
MQPPLIRVVTPRLDFATSSSCVTAGGLVLLPGKWNAEPMADVLARVRQLLISSARLDMEATQPCYTAEEFEASLYRSALLKSATHPTQSRFSHEYQLYSSESVGSSHTLGNKVLLPSSALMELTHNGDQQLPAPILFELTTTDGVRTHVGVWEFSAPEGQIIAPEWVLRNLRATSGDAVRLRLVTLPRGSLLRLQPFTRRFLQVNGNDKFKVLAMLEAAMPLFAAFTTGDVIEVVHDGEAFRFFVLDCKPEKCITCIAEPFLDMEIDFVSALDWKESVDAPAATPSAAGDTGQRLGAALQSGGDHVLCPYCRKSVPAASSVMHEAACQRRNVVCPQCGDVVAKVSFFDKAR